MAEIIRFQEVNIALGDEMSEYFTKASEETWKIRPEMMDLSGVAFGSAAMIDGDFIYETYKKGGSVSFGLQLDGIGTRTEIDERMNEHFGSAQNLFAMVVDDAPAGGGETIAVGNILDIRELNAENEIIIHGMKQLANGMVSSARNAGTPVLSGEIAELGKRVSGYGDFNYNWGGVGFVVVNKERKLTGKELSPGQALVGLAEPGFRSNGITDVRNAMEQHYGNEWHLQVEPLLGKITLGELMHVPSTIYSGLMRELQGGFNADKEPKAEVTGVAHITGGGQPSKLGRMLLRTEGLGIVIDNPLNPPEMMLHVQRLREFDDRKAYGKWHMGSGMVVATRTPEKVIAEAAKFEISAQEIGYIADEPGIRIKNRGAVQNEEWLVF